LLLAYAGETEKKGVLRKGEVGQAKEARHAGNGGRTVDGEDANFEGWGGMSEYDEKKKGRERQSWAVLNGSRLGDPDET